MSKLNCVVYCNCGAGVFSNDKSDALVEILNSFQVDVFELHDLCAMSLHEKERLNQIGALYSQKIIIACYPRAIENLFKQNEISFGDYQVINLRVEDALSITRKLHEEYHLPEGKPNYKIEKSTLNVPAWYPVIDHDRCTLCGQCFRFCLFGVYRFDKKTLTVAQPLSCKNNCPACGRTCPASAIIFPRLPENSVLSGDEPKIDQSPSAKDKGGLFVQLNQRNSQRKNILKQGFMQMAEEERSKALEELKKGINKQK